MKWLTTCALVAASSFGAAACETDVVDDTGFQLWCGESLCSWVVEEGEIGKVSTWHEHDYGVALVGSPVLLSQSAQRGACAVRIEVTSEIDEAATVSVEIDGDGDGVVDRSVVVPSSDGYTSRAWEVGVDLTHEGTIYLRKSGEGHAVIARLRVSAKCLPLG